ncbi:MAG: hypothetical protein ACJ0BT_01760 [Pseudohongiellaceae bacterium]
MKIKIISKITTFIATFILATTLFAQPEDAEIEEDFFGNAISIGTNNRLIGSPRDRAPVNLTSQILEGQWVSIVNEDWLWRMRVPEKGDFMSIPYNELAAEAGQTWDESMSNSCLAYGAAGIMRQPMRFRIEWESDSIIRLETDFGQQTRRFIFNEPVPENTPKSLQGYSIASWELDEPIERGFFGVGIPEDSLQYGSLKVETSHLTAAWLRSNGAPASDSATITELFDVFIGPDGNEWMVATVIVHDPIYLNVDFITSSHFRRETDLGDWDPRPCEM